MELAPLGSVPFIVWVVRLARPLDNVTHTLHNGHNFNGFDVVVVLGDSSMVYLCSRVLA